MSSKKISLVNLLKSLISLQVEAYQKKDWLTYDKVENKIKKVEKGLLD